MILYTLRLAIRRLFQFPQFSLFNLLGLTLGISSCLIILLYVYDELTFDRFHPQGEQIHRVMMHEPGNFVMGSSNDWWVVSPFILKPTWEKELPEVELVTRTLDRQWIFELGNSFAKEDILLADPEFFQLFNFPLQSGDGFQALSQPKSIIISQEMAKKYFGSQNPLGESLVTNNGNQFVVQGVLEKVPHNSHLQFDFVVGFKTYEEIIDRSLISDNWLNNSYKTYLSLAAGTDLEAFDQKLRPYDVEGFNGQTWTFHLQPLHDIHFNRSLGGEGNYSSLLIFGTIGLFILFIACFNYINLYLAHYRTRIKGIAIRKIQGATRSQLIGQLLAESSIQVICAYVISLLLLNVLLPFLSEILGQTLYWERLIQGYLLAYSLILVACVGLISGLLPAVYLSAMRIVQGLKGSVGKLSGANRIFRNAVVAIQLAVSILLILGTLTVYQQLNFVAEKDLGYEQENIVFLPTGGLWYNEDGEWKNHIQRMQDMLHQDPSIITSAGSSNIPSDIGWSYFPTWEGMAENEKPFFYRLICDEHFLDLYGIELQNGRNFSTELSRDSSIDYIVNQAAVQHMQLPEPLHKAFGFDEDMGSIVGVAEDFHLESLHKPITPLAIGFDPNYEYEFISVKIAAHQLQQGLGAIEDSWSQLAPKVPMDVHFFDTHIDRLYRQDRKLSKSLLYFSGIALLIACMGILGIMSFYLKERLREISIRKVLGAGAGHLVRLLTKDVVLMLGIAVLIGGLTGWYVTSDWLQAFAYRIDMSVLTVLLATLICFLVVFVPLGVKLWQVLQANPAEVLRSE